MDEISKYRLTGAAIWLALLVVIVPGWYSNPVNFKPDSERVDSSAVNQRGEAIVYQPYVLPSKPQANADNSQAVVAEPVASVVQQDKQQIESRAAAPAVQSDSQHQSVESTKATKPAKTVEPQSQQESKKQWLVKVYSSNKIKDANRVLGLLDDRNDVWIKEYSNPKAYSVRTGPYDSRALAEKVKRKIDKAIRTQAEVVEVK